MMSDLFLILSKGLFGNLDAPSLEGIKIIVLVINQVFMRLSAA